MEREKVRRDYTHRAVALAVQGRWEEAVATNRAILELFPEDVDAYNRLGKALMKLGKYSEAKEAYNCALQLDPRNSIAQKNLSRLSHLSEISSLPPDNHHQVDLNLFIEETAKSGIVSLVHLAPLEFIARMTTGDEVYLKVEGERLLVHNAQGEYLGEVEPRYGLRLARLIKGGNEYAAAITSLGGREVKLIIREIYQHPSQAGILSFPLKGRKGFVPYVEEELAEEDGTEEDRELAATNIKEDNEDFEEEVNNGD